MNIENFRKNLVEKFVKGFNDDFKAENAFHLLRVKNIEKQEKELKDRASQMQSEVMKKLHKNE